MAAIDLTELFLAQAQDMLKQVHLPRIVSCMEELSPQQIWWRPNPASNSAGNLVLHLSGNVRQWIVSGVGGATDTRERDKEFAEQGPLPRRALISGLRKVVNEACRVLAKFSVADLARVYPIQGYNVTGLEAAFHVTEHFSHHAGQIILITKMLEGRNLEFTHLPGEKKKKSNRVHS
jgi:uncharacterized damage-inducible protein DinB